MEIKQAILAFAAATRNDVFDPEVEGGGDWVVEAVRTSATIDDFIDAAHRCWREHGEMKSGEIAGFKFVFWPGVQTRKGEQRREVSVIDFGDVRYAIKYDLTRFIDE